MTARLKELLAIVEKEISYETVEPGCGVCGRAYPIPMQTVRALLECLIEARESLALMEEGEGNEVWVYREMSGAARKAIDEKVGQIK